MEPFPQLGLLHPSRSEIFPFAERVMMLGEVPIRYFDSGAGPAVVFVHGLGGNLSHFEYVAGPLAESGYRVCGLDLPGFGLSGKPHRRYSVAYLAETVRELMDRLGIERATLCGHSLGGLVCAELAQRAPARVERLVLISSAGLSAPIPLPFRWLARKMMLSGLLAEAFERNAGRLLGLVFEAHNERTELFKARSLTRPDPSFCIDLGRVMASMRRDLTEYHLFDRAERIAMPTLVIWGAQDRLLRIDRVPAWTKSLKAGELEVIEACGHMPIIEHPERVVARMKSFLETTGARADRSSPRRQKRARAS